MNKKHQALRYLFFDITTAAISWTLFFVFRKKFIEPEVFGYPVPVEFSSRYFMGLLFIPLFWFVLYFMAGFYRNVLRKSILLELGYSLLVTLLGGVIIFFTLLLDDTIASYRNYYTSFLALLSIHFVISYLPRLILTSITFRKIRKGRLVFNTLVIGGNGKACQVIRDIRSEPVSTGNRIIGFIGVAGQEKFELDGTIPFLGQLENLYEVIDRYGIEEVIIAIEKEEHAELERIITLLEGRDLIIKTIPTLYDILIGRVKYTAIFGTPLIEVRHELIPLWQASIKRLMDVTISLTAILISLPLTAVLVVIIKMTSSGPVIYSHERIGRHGKPFRIYKFRSMFDDAETNGPMLSSRDDPRITPVGRFLRRTRIDELPNFFNVLRGEMSLVGPRPERQYYIDMILPKAPHYIHLQKVKPGITSWGQVKFGYAENIDEMLQRLKYDLIYIENMSLYVDLKIMFYTLITILKGKGI